MMRAALLLTLWVAASETWAPDSLPDLTVSPPDLTVPRPALTATLVGNAGVLLTDGQTSLLVDLPYEPGAFGYAMYDPDALDPPGQVVSVITHHHTDHVDPDLFMAREAWRMVGPPSVTAALPSEPVIAGDSVTVGAFTVVPVPTPHTDDHRSYRIRWQGLVLWFTGDTNDGSRILMEPRIDVLFITPWLMCGMRDAGDPPHAARVILYHMRTDEADPHCGAARPQPQGAVLTLSPSEPGLEVTLPTVFAPGPPA